MDRTPRIVKTREVCDSAGQLSAKLVITDVNGVEHWEFYDTRLFSEDPVDGRIIVFNSLTGEYEPCGNLAEAKQKFIEHYKRLTYTIEVSGGRCSGGAGINATRDPGSAENIDKTTEIIFL